VAALSQAEAKKNFLTICRRAIQTGQRAYVKDKSEKRYLTIDPEARHLSDPVLDMSAQFFKDNFGRCSSLIKDGLCFRLTLRGVNESIFARRHTAYSDPCDPVIANWQSQIESGAFARQQEAKIMSILQRIELRRESDQEEIMKAVRELKLGIARQAIGHRPFEEGHLPNDA
jgi:hypothetical protein